MCVCVCVCVCVCLDEARPDQVDMMIKEGSLTKGLRHPNINCVCASCFEPQYLAPLLIYPFLDEGNLKKFLQRCRISDVGLNQVLVRISGDFCFALQIAL